MAAGAIVAEDEAFPAAPRDTISEPSGVRHSI